MISGIPISARPISANRNIVVVAVGGGVTTPGGLHHIMEGMGDTGEGARVPQTLHTINQGVTTA